MKDFFQKIKALLKKNGGKVKEKISPIRPYRDWVMVFSLAVFGIVLISALSIYLAYLFKTGKFFAGGQTETAQRAGFEQEKLLKALEVYKNREEEFNKSREQKVEIKDPST